MEKGISFANEEHGHEVEIVGHVGHVGEVHVKGALKDRYSPGPSFCHRNLNIIRTTQQATSNQHGLC